MNGVRAADPASPLFGGLPVARSIREIDNSTSTVIDVDQTDAIQCRPSAPRLVSDIVYESTTTRYGQPLSLKLDLQIPAEATAAKPLPLVVFITGGGFFIAPKGSALDKRTFVADAGYVVATIEYRVVDSGTAVDAVADTKAAIRFLRARSGDYHIDPRHVAVWGESAGGYLAAMAGTTAALRPFEAGPNLDRSSAVQAVVDMYGLSDLTRIGADYDAATEAAHHSAEMTEAEYVNGRESGLGVLDDRAAAKKVNPITYVDADDPPFLLFHGRRDGLVSPSQTLLLHTELRAAGVASRRYVVNDTGHAGTAWSSNEVMDLVVAFLDHALKR